MRRRSLPLISLLLLMLAGCGGGNDNAGFPDCGNGVLDAGEECDDGNLIDTDGCLSTCKLNVCGDSFLNLGVEECEQGVLGARCVGGTNIGRPCQADADCPPQGIGTCQSVDCTSLGFASGTLACTTQCTFDTSGCTGSGPTPTTTVGPASPGGVTPTPGGTPGPSGAATPTVAPTPAGVACQDGDQVVVIASLDKTYGAARIDLGYPASLNIPGTGSAQSVADRVHFADGGLTTVNDTDQNGDGIDDTLTASLVSFADNAPGPFVTVTFDCVAGHAPPTAADFDCTVVSASTGGGVTIPDEQCGLAVQ